MKLYRLHICLRDTEGIHVRIDVRFHHTDLHLIPQKFHGLLQRGGFSRSGRGHQIQKKDSLFLQLVPQQFCLMIIVGKNALFDLIYLYHLFCSSRFRLNGKSGSSALCALRAVSLHYSIHLREGSTGPNRFPSVIFPGKSRCCTQRTIPGDGTFTLTKRRGIMIAPGAIRPDHIGPPRFCGDYTQPAVCEENDASGVAFFPAHAV